MKVTYCLFSDAPRCDVHCYESADGVFVLKVRSHLQRGEQSEQPGTPQMPLAGETMRFQTLRALRAQVMVLRCGGYQVPAEVVALLDAGIRRAPRGAGIGELPALCHLIGQAPAARLLPTAPQHLA